MERTDLRALTEEEIELVRPEVEVILRGLQAQDRLARTIALLGSGLNIEGLELDLRRMVLTRPDIGRPPVEAPSEE